MNKSITFHCLSITEEGWGGGGERVGTLWAFPGGEKNGLGPGMT